MIGIYEGGSVYDPQGFPEKDLSEYKELNPCGELDDHCPYCGESIDYVLEHDEYEIDGETYPQYLFSFKFIYKYLIHILFLKLEIVLKI